MPIEIPKDILLIDKPSGITSFDCIRILRKELGIKKMGHAGTLDPLASGLMIIGVETGTKKLTNYIKLPKKYIATIRLGIQTDTGDLEGKVVKESVIDAVSEDVVKSVIRDMQGTHRLSVPKYSAIKKRGKPLYKYAREGSEVEIPERDMVVRNTTLISVDVPDVVVEFDVESGVYIRSLAEEVGKRLGVPATLAALRRTSIGEFSVEDAKKV